MDVHNSDFKYNSKSTNDKRKRNDPISTNKNFGVEGLFHKPEGIHFIPSTYVKKIVCL